MHIQVTLPPDFCGFGSARAGWGGADGLVGGFEHFSKNPPERLAPGGTLISMQETKTAEMSFSDNVKIDSHFLLKSIQKNIFKNS